MPTPAPDVTISLEPNLACEEFAQVLVASTLGERRPVDDLERLAGMLRQADIIVTARTPDGRLVGVSRALTDFHHATYLADLAVDRSHQRQGIGKRLIAATHEAAGLSTMLILIAAPAARDYYPHIGMQQHPSCWTAIGEWTGVEAGADQ